jgi:hypothetical protein
MWNNGMGDTGWSLMGMVTVEWMSAHTMQMTEWLLMAKWTDKGWASKGYGAMSKQDVRQNKGKKNVYRGSHENKMCEGNARKKRWGGWG